MAEILLMTNSFYVPQSAPLWRLKLFEHLGGGEIN